LFTQETLDFLAENCFMGSREWFNAHKKDYISHVKEPLTDFCLRLGPDAAEIDPLLVTDPKTATSRIFRDMRFARGGSPYRDVQWVSFRREREAYSGWPEFFFVFSPREFFYGTGYYSASAGAMETVRELIKSGDPAFRKAQAALEAHPEIQIGGDLYKRSRHMEYTEPLRAWLDRKNLRFTVQPGDVTELFAEDLAEKVSAAWRAMAPVYEFLMRAEKAARKL